jgi:hypothetical protein
LHANVKHFASPEFWEHYRQMPEAVRKLADKNFALLKANPRHPSVQLKKTGQFWSARVGLRYRVLAKERSEGLTWFWIGPHGVYDQFK